MTTITIIIISNITTIILTIIIVIIITTIIITIFIISNVLTTKPVSGTVLSVPCATTHFIFSVAL